MYQLAENLHMTVGRMMREMSFGEYLGWMRFYTQRNQKVDPKTGKPNLLASDSDGLLKGMGL